MRKGSAQHWALGDFGWAEEALAHTAPRRLMQPSWNRGPRTASVTQDQEESQRTDAMDLKCAAEPQRQQDNTDKAQSPGAAPLCSQLICKGVEASRGERPVSGNSRTTGVPAHTCRHTQSVLCPACRINPEEIPVLTVGPWPASGRMLRGKPLCP